MINATQITEVNLDGADGVIVIFSDGTSAGYVAEELLGLRPYRDRVGVHSSSGAAAPSCPDSLAAT